MRKAAPWEGTPALAPHEFKHPRRNPRTLATKPKKATGYIPPSAATVVICFQILTFAVAATVAAITAYARYKTNENYIGAALNYLTWGVKATHRSHNFDKRKGWYETAVQDAGYNAGHRVILDKEDHTRMNVRNTEGTWDGMKFEIAAAETGTSNNIRNSLKHCASKPDCEVAVVFFPNKKNATMDVIRSGISKYTGLEHTKQYRRFAKIYFITEDDIIHWQ